MNKQRIMLMFANEYDMKTDDGKMMRGCVLNYYFFGTGGETLKVDRANVGSVGYQRAKCSVDYDMRQKVVAAPAIYDAEFTMKVGSDGKPVLVVTDLTYVGDAKFSLDREK